MTELSDPERRKLEAELFEALRKDCAESRRLGYPPKIFESMMGQFGPVEACRKVIVAERPPDGFIKLLELSRLDLTAEATVLRGPWRKLFHVRSPPSPLRSRKNMASSNHLPFRRTGVGFTGK